MLQNIKCEVKELFGGSTIDLSMKEIMILIGQNGTGKTLILILAWIGTYLTSAKITMTGVGSITTPDSDKILVDFVCKNSFSNYNFNGKVTFNFEDDITTTIIFKEGACESITYSNITEKSKITNIIYMSTSMRLYKEQVRYLKLRKKLNGISSVLSPEALSGILEDYPLYDTHTVELMLNKLPLEFSSEIGKALVDSYQFKETPVRFTVDLDACKYTLHYSDETTQDVLTFGNGHQAILNMMVTKLIN